MILNLFKGLNKLLFAIFLLFFFLGSVVFAGISDWYYIESDNYVVFYPGGYENRAKQTLYYLELHRPLVMSLTGNKNFKPRVVIQDLGFVTNAYAYSIANKISIFTSDVETISPLGSGNWYEFVSLHEQTHIAQLNNYSGPGAVFPIVYGNLFSPNLYTPGWMKEGIAVYTESKISPYQGRLNSGYYGAIVKTQAKAGTLPNVQKAGAYLSTFPADGIYVYGGYFMEFLAEKYGEDKLAKYFDELGSQPYIPLLSNLMDFFPMTRLDAAANVVFEKGFDRLFEEWKKYEEKNARNWKMDGTRITLSGWYKKHLIASAESEHRLYYLRTINRDVDAFFDYSRQDLMEYDTKAKTERVLDSFVSDRYTGSAGKITVKIQKNGAYIYYAMNNVRNGYSNVDYRSLGINRILKKFDLETKRTSTLFTDDILCFYARDSDEILYVKKPEQADLFGSEIWEFKEGEKSKVFALEVVVAQMIFHRGKYIVVYRDRDSSWNIGWLDLEKKKITPILYSPYEEFEISLLKNDLYFTANYEGKYRIYKYNLNLGKLYKLTENGYAFGGVVQGKNVYFVGLTDKGEEIFKKQLKLNAYQLSMKREKLGIREDLKPEKFEGPKEAVFKNFSYALWPDYRFFTPYFVAFAGADGLGFNNYYLYYSPLGLFGMLQSSMFQPFNITVGGLLGNFYEASVTYPLYTSGEKGLQAIIPFVAVTYDTPGDSVFGEDHTSYIAHSIGSTFVVRYPAFDVMSSIRYERNHESYVTGQGSFTYFLDNGNIFASVVNSRHSNLSYDYFDTWSNTYATLGISHKIGEVRSGLWNPNIVIGDVFLTYVVYAELEEPREVVDVVGFGIEGLWFIPVNIKLDYTGEKGFRGDFSVEQKF